MLYKILKKIWKTKRKATQADVETLQYLVPLQIPTFLTDIVNLGTNIFPALAPEFLLSSTVATEKFVSPFGEEEG